MNSSTCKCGKPRGQYASCADCRAYHAKWLRGNRAKLKAQRGFSQWRYAPANVKRWRDAGLRAKGIK